MFFRFLVFLEIILLSFHSLLLSHWDLIIDDFEIEQSSPVVVNGACWSSNTQPTISAPWVNLCISWNSTAVVSWQANFTWSCNGENSWTNASCSAPRQYTVIFDGNGWTGHTPSNKVVIYNDKIWTLPSIPTRNWYVFLGWFPSLNWSTPITENTIVTQNTTYYAKWLTNINGNCWAAHNMATLWAPGGNLCISWNPTAVVSWQANFTWSCNGENSWTNASCSAPRQYTVIFDGNGWTGHTPSNKVVIYNDKIWTLPSIPTRNWYVFLGWFPSLNWSTPITENTIVTQNTTYYAKWLTNINGNCWAAHNMATLWAPGGNLCISWNPTAVVSWQANFTWSCNGENSWTNASCSAPRQYIVSYNANGGTPPIPQTQNIIYNNEIGTLAITSRDEYIFKWWYTTQTGGTRMTQNTKIIWNTTLYAQWDLKINGVCWSATTKAVISPPWSDLCASWTPTGVISWTWSFTWSCNGESGINASCSTPREYTVTFDGNGGVTPVPQTQNIIYDNEIGPLAITSRSNYTFQWWYTTQTGGTQITQNTKILSHVTWYAQWQEIILPSSWGWGWWWGGGGWAVTPKDNCPLWDSSPSYYDGICGEENIKTDWTAKQTQIIDQVTPSFPKDTPIPKTDTPPKENPIIPKNKELKQCEANDLVKARQCVFPKLNIYFSDIESSFAKNYIQALWSAGIIHGYYNTSLFQPNHTISRAEYLKVLLRAFCIDYQDMVTYDISFEDVDKNAWEAKVIAKALKLWVIDQKNKKFRPHDPVTRAESLKMLFQISWVVPKEAYITRFEDVNQSGWEIKYIQKAKDMCIVDGYSVDGRILFQPYKNMTRAEVSKVIANTLKMK